MLLNYVCLTQTPTQIQHYQRNTFLNCKNYASNYFNQVIKKIFLKNETRSNLWGILLIQANSNFVITICLTLSSNQLGVTMIKICLIFLST